MSAEATANSSGRSRLSLFKGGSWKLISEWGTPGDGELSAGRLLFRARAMNSNIDNLIAADSMWIDAITFNSGTIGVTFTYGPTMDTIPYPILTIGHSGGDSTADAIHITSLTTTTFRADRKSKRLNSRH